MASKPSSPTDHAEAKPLGINRLRAGLFVGVRRAHLYLGLFLTPWMLVYALSTLAMAHRDWVQSLYSSPEPAMVLEQELSYTSPLPGDAPPQQRADQILRDLGLEGTYRLNGGREGRPLVIDRQHALTPRRITWHSDTGQLVIERQEFRSPTILERLHRRRGYQQPYALDDAWAFCVDLTVLTMVFWVASGLWMTWDHRAGRRWGALCALGGWTLFGALLFLL